MRIILFRHGEHKANRLTDFGVEAVKLIGQQLKEFNIKQIFCSPAERCVETAKILSKIVGVPKIQLKENLTERFQLNHSPTNSAEKEWWDNYMNLSYKPKMNTVGETCFDYISRNQKVFNEILKSPSDEDVLIVAHSSTSYALANFVWRTKDLHWIKLGNANYVVFEI